MPTQTLLTITQQLRRVPNSKDAVHLLIEWVTRHFGNAYLMLPDGLFITESIMRDREIVRWVSDRSQWRNLDTAQLDSGNLFVPLHFSGRTNGVLVVEAVDDNAWQMIPVVEILAARLDTEFTASMMFSARHLAEQLNNTTTLPEMLQLAVEGLVALFDASNAVVFQFKPDDVHGEVIAEYPTRVAIGRDLGAQNYTAFSRFFSKESIVTLTDEVEIVNGIKLKTAMRTIGAKQVTMSPMYTMGRLVGTVAISLSESVGVRQLTGREKQLLQMLTHVISNALVVLRRTEHPKDTILDDTMFRQLIDKANVAIDIHAPDGKVIYRNEAWNDLFQIKANDTPVFQDRLLDEEKFMAETLIYPNATRSKGWTNFITLRRRDLSQFDAHVSVVALRDNQENVVGYSTITDDVTELHHVMDALQSQTTRLAAAASVSQAIITTPDLHELAENVLRLICTQFNYDLAHIWILNDTRNELACISACNYLGETIESVQGAILSLDQESAAKWVINNGRMSIMNDAQNDSRHWQHNSLPLVGSELVLILQATHEVLGVMVVQSKKRDAFTLDDTDVMQSIADQLAIAIYNTSLFSQLSERLADMSAMGEVSLLVQGAFDLDGLMRRIYDAMRRVHATGNFTFAMPGKVANQMTVITYRDGQAEKSVRPILDDLTSIMLSQPAAIFWRNTDERTATAKYFGLSLDEMPYSFLGLPVIARDNVLGALYTESNRYAAFDENDLQFMLNLANSAAFAIENMQLLDDTKRRVREMELINSISHTLSETFGLNSMWDQLAGDLEQLFPHGVVTIALYDAITETLKAPVMGDDLLMLAPPEPLGFLVVNNGISLVFHDLVNADDRLESMGIDIYEINVDAVRSWIGTPLRNRNNETIGVIALQSNRASAFTDRDLSLLNMVAAQTSLALDNAFLLNAEQERREIANSLIDMGRVVTSTLNVDDVFARILEQIARLLNYDRAAIMIPADNNMAQLSVHAIDGYDEIYYQKIVKVNTKSALWQVLQTQEPMTIGRVAEYPAWKYQPAMLQGEQVKSWMGVPLVVQGHVQGVISLDTTNDIPYTDEDATPIFALARQASIAVENAQLHTELEDNVFSLKMRAERLATMHRLANYVSSSLSQSAILEHTSNLLTDLFKASYACIIRIDEMDGNGYLTSDHPPSGFDGQAMMVKGTETFDYFQNVVRQNTAMLISADNPLATMIPIETPVTGCVIAPLIAHERVLGCILLVLDDQMHTFDDENLETFMTIAAQVAVAVRNAELFQDALDASRLKSEFLANVSHELRTPLNAIIGYSELLLGGTYGSLHEKQEDRLERVFRSGRQLLTLINDILDLSKIEAGKMELEPVEIDISHLITDATSTIQPQIEYKQLDFIRDVQANLPPVFVDPKRMRQILVNLLSNAVKFTKEGQVGVSVRRATVTLREFPKLPLHMISQGNVWLHLSIIDTGIGIDEKDQLLIFDAFTQADGSSIREYEGTGLGLAITKQLVKLHKGHIWLESEAGVGSTFHILLPSMETVQTSKYSVAPNDNRPVIVLADEDEMTLQLMSEYLNPQQYNVMSVRDASEIFKIAEIVIPSVIITDIIAPHSEGMSLLKDIRTHPVLGTVNVVVCSILDREKESLDLGAVAFIKKPATRGDILDIVEKLV